MLTEEDLFEIVDYLLALQDDELSNIPEPILHTIFQQRHDLYKSLPLLRKVETPAVVLGDTHGSFSGLRRLLLHLNAFCSRVADHRTFLFWGDFVDRGEQGLEVLLLLLTLSLLKPDKFLLIRGNHEDRAQNIKYGFYAEIREKRYLSESFMDVIVRFFEQLTIAAVVAE